MKERTHRRAGRKLRSGRLDVLVGMLFSPHLAGITLFTLASLVGGFAATAGELLAARAAQGIGAALASPSALARLMTMFAQGRERTRAVGL
ncbi:MAG: transporter [Frankiales bacterium]|nr:transporter [Frankiales bacterium]